MFKKGFTHLVKALRKNQSSAKLMQPPSRFLLTGLRCARPSAFTLSCKSFRSNPLTALLRSRLSRFSQTKFRSLAAHSCGFTLAEVLITLSILGIVAAISIPNIIQQYQKRLTITKLQKAYAELENMATNLAINTDCFGRDVNCAISAMNVKELKENVDINNKIINFVNFKNKNLYTVASPSKPIYPLYCNGKCNSVAAYVTKVINSNGIGYNFYASNYITVRDATETISNMGNGIKVSVFTDLSKNAILVRGKNVFDFVIWDNFKVEPAKACHGGTSCGMSLKCNRSYDNIDNYCSKSKMDANSGWSCAAKIVKDGWKINY